MSSLDWSTSDLADEHGDRARVIPPLHRHYGGLRRFAGASMTVQCFEDNSRVKELVSTAGDGRVMVVDGGGGTRCALVGDILAGQALENGWAAIIVHGCVRDAHALSTLNLGVMALATSPRRSQKNGDGRTDVPIEIAGVPCRPGDRVYADEDGIVILPATSAPRGAG